jgi:myo-inositol-1(or 4)-monophosphatase
MPAPSLDDLLRVAREAARAAGDVALRGYGSALEITSKGGTDIVTQYDHAAEVSAMSVVRATFPDHNFLAEESGSSGDAEGPGAACVWLIDPIDGTHNYAYQLPFWCVSVAVTDGASGQVLAAAIYDPLHGEMFSAARGCGAELNGQPIRVSSTEEVSKAIVAYDIGHEPSIAHRMLTLVAHVQPRVAKVRHLGSAALSLTYVASGRVDAYYHLGLQPWDVAAALLLIQEAGGTITDWDGTPRLSGQGSAVAASTGLHPRLLAMLHEADPS